MANLYVSVLMGETPQDARPVLGLSDQAITRHLMREIVRLTDPDARPTTQEMEEGRREGGKAHD